MYKIFRILTFFLIAVPSLSLASDEIDFYSKIDDAGNEIAAALTTRHLQEYKSFRWFGKRCRGEAAWLDSESISERDLQDIQQDNLTFLTKLAAKKKKKLTNEEINEIATCLKTTYGSMQQEAIRQQHQITTAGGYGIYMDGSLKNSDYDIIDDLNKINKILFTQPPKYNGPANNNQKSLLDFLKGKDPEWLEDENGDTQIQDPDITTVTESVTTITTPAPSQDGEGNIPWVQECSTENELGNTGNLPGNLVDGNFTTELEHTLTYGDNWQEGGVDNSQTTNESEENSQSNEDFFHKVPCNKMFCITIDFLANTRNGSLWRDDKSIEWLLNKHIEMMEPISRSDLSAQKMTNNSFQLPFLNIRIADKIAGARVFIHNKPQKVKRLKTEDTEEKKEAIFDSAYDCALIDAGLEPNKEKNPGAQGAGYSLVPGQTIGDVHLADKTLAPKDPTQITKNPNIQTKCRNIRERISKQKREVVFVGDLNELYSFTEAATDIIAQILDAEKAKLDWLPVR